MAIIYQLQYDWPSMGSPYVNNNVIIILNDTLVLVDTKLLASKKTKRHWVFNWTETALDYSFTYNAAPMRQSHLKWCNPSMKRFTHDAKAMKLYGYDQEVTKLVP